MISGIELGSPRGEDPVERSELKEESHFFLKVGKEDTSIQILEKDFVALPGYNYRIVHNLQQASAKHQGFDLYADSGYTIDPATQFPNEKILVKRLGNLYGITNKPHFFDLNSQPTKLEDNDNVPHCIKQLGLFDLNHYKSLFITQDWEESAKYILTANINGRFEVISIDDRIPIYIKTLQPLWGLSYKNPWEILLIKAFAKIKGGYDEVFKCRPFQFIETFTNSTWKYFNLSKEPQKFFKHYNDNNRFKNGKIVLRTKKDAKIYSDGLQPNSACYQLVNIQEEGEGEKKNYVITVRTTELVKWVEGHISLYRPIAQKYFFQGLSLDHDMIMTDKQFRKYFATAHITSTRHEDYFSGYKILDIQRYERKAQHFEFTIHKEGFFDFSILQFQNNRVVKAGEQSRLFLDEGKLSQVSGMSGVDNVRYLRTKYILVRDNNYDHDLEPWMNKSKVVEKSKMESSKIKAIKGDADYPLPRFTTYEIQYFKGYSKGNAHFVKLDAGRYILRLKAEQVDTDTRFAINWVCSHRIELSTAKLSIQQEKDLLQDSMVSIMHKYPYFSFNKQEKAEMLTIANSFEEIGYGFASIKCSNSCNRSIIIQIDPKVLDQEGYRLKGRYKEHSDTLKKFSIKVEAGEYDSIVFKKKKDVVNFVWPTNSISIYKKQIKEPQYSHIQVQQSQLNYSQGQPSIIKQEKKGGSNIYQPNSP